MEVEPSRTVEIICEVPDETTPATWYKDDVKLVSDGVKYEMATKKRKRSLVLHDVKPDDAGKYVCEVGDHRTTTTLEVKKEVPKEGKVPKEEEVKGRFYEHRVWDVHVWLVHLILPCSSDSFVDFYFFFRVYSCMRILCFLSLRPTTKALAWI